MQPAPLVSILIVNWNACELLRACLASLVATREPLEIIVVDNNSLDNSVSMVRESFGNVTLMASSTNLGFAAANNLAAAHAHSDFLLLLNPDTTIPAGAIAAMVQFANAHPKIGALGPELRTPDGSRQRSCWRGYPGLSMALSDALYLWKAPWLPFAHQSEYRADELQTARPVDHLLGACILIRRAAWEQVGPLDPNYFLFLEETDWCLRARRADWEIYYLPNVFITHYGQQSMRQAPRRNVPQFYKSYIRFDRAHHAGAGLRELALKSIIALACALRIGMWKLRARAAHGQARTQANAMVTGYWKTLTELGSF